MVRRLMLAILVGTSFLLVSTSTNAQVGFNYGYYGAGNVAGSVYSYGNGYWTPYGTVNPNSGNGYWTPYGTINPNGNLGYSYPSYGGYYGSYYRAPRYYVSPYRSYAGRRYRYR